LDCVSVYQEDFFQLVGVPLVKSALAGYNASILSYGEVL
jgi:kinesin family protein 15